VIGERKYTIRCALGIPQHPAVKILFVIDRSSIANQGCQFFIGIEEIFLDIDRRSETRLCLHYPLKCTVSCHQNHARQCDCDEDLYQGKTSIFSHMQTL